jgi:peptidoglycan hydrolase CwlO-like protein
VISLGVAELHAYRNNGKSKAYPLERDVVNFNMKFESYQMARAMLDKEIAEFQEQAQVLQAQRQDLQQRQTQLEQVFADLQREEKSINERAADRRL